MYFAILLEGSLIQPACMPMKMEFCTDQHHLTTNNVAYCEVVNIDFEIKKRREVIHGIASKENVQCPPNSKNTSKKLKKQTNKYLLLLLM